MNTTFTASILFRFINPFNSRVFDGICKVALTFESVDQILYGDHSNESSLPVLTHGTICFSKFYKMKFGNLVEICLWLHLAVKELRDKATKILINYRFYLLSTG